LHTKKTVLDQVADSIRSAGYDPYTQLYGYLNTGNDTYITRHGNAREIVCNTDKNALEAYLILLKGKHS
jgi:uncharacterized protein (UPF0297 family)